MKNINELFPREGIERLSEFLYGIKNETYPEIPMEAHLKISNQLIDMLTEKIGLARDSKILDVGCGQGLALKKFSELGFSPIGITLNETDYEVCREKGYEVYLMDQSFLQFQDSEFDFLWARHVLEHSIFPYYTLHEYNRVLKENSFIYIEAPGSGTLSEHERNPNHYSVLTKKMWKALFERAGYSVVWENTISLELEVGGEDVYWSFLLINKTIKM